MNQQRILIVEDNPALAGVIKFNLERVGYPTCVARNGHQGCQLATAQTFDLIISDLQMPGMDGIELLGFLRTLEQYRQTPFFMLTAKAMELEGDELFAQLNVAKLIAKPFSPAEIVRNVQEIFETSSASTDRPHLQRGS